MGYSKTVGGPGFYNFVQPFLSEVPKKPEDLPLVLVVDTDRAGSCAYHWRNYFHSAFMKHFYKISQVQLSSDPTKTQVVIQFRERPTERRFDVHAHGRLKPSTSPVINPANIGETIKLTQTELDLQRTPEEQQEFESNLEIMKRIAAEEGIIEEHEVKKPKNKPVINADTLFPEEEVDYYEKFGLNKPERLNEPDS